MRSEQPRRVSLEFFPPKTEKGTVRLRQVAQALSELSPHHASVTFGAGGSTRDGTYQTVQALIEDTRLVPRPHISCIGSTRAQLREMLQRYQALGIQQVVALRGDLPASEGPIDVASDFRYANELVAFIRTLGGFHISVGCYPEVHPEAANPEADLENFCRKAEAGADEAITQYFFSNAAYYDFVERVRRRGVNIPILPGLMPLTDFAKIVRFSTFCGAEIPLWIRKRMEHYASDPASQFAFGIEIAVRQAEDLLRNGAPGLHIYTLNQAEPALQIGRQLGLGLRAQSPLAQTTTAS